VETVIVVLFDMIDPYSFYYKFEGTGIPQFDYQTKAKLLSTCQTSKAYKLCLRVASKA
jgi:hypothetical protein